MIGIDVIEVGRFKIKNTVKNAAFFKKIFTSAELEYATEKGVHRAETLAGIFAAKEAVRKAFGDEDLLVSDVEIFHTKKGRPCAKILGKTKANVKISITHTTAIAIGVCVVL